MLSRKTSPLCLVYLSPNRSVVVEGQLASAVAERQLVAAVEVLVVAFSVLLLVHPSSLPVVIWKFAH